ncbi:c-type cytochrome biogenesis protein CcmI [Aurantimonas sp. VKM B-3413]|uniref:c-type cytochrome biogenesis protein CcmI n=1 Tax=Aurantimonas sp. VKM B-3413 TaxID=2779401 RepID=UPI001E4B778E|nr:c-type cytochrome biogenesis protein CcmI [Aurantimonas sp. VKM B-3413]MCB8836084.1 c-type cytochrome biogenesis protein CcmI [Aurantimonas sp. VKM B-3413]
MEFWVIAAVMTAAVTLAVLWPLLRRRSDEFATRADHDVEVYAAQLRELEADVERGTMAAPEAETARAEIGRRLLKASERAGQPLRSGRQGWRKSISAAAILAVVVVVPALSTGLYAFYGGGGRPDLPLASREVPSGTDMSMDKIVAAAEERLKQNPADGRGWDLLAPVYLQLDQPGKAATAYRNAIRLLGSTATREDGLGEALTQIAGGEVTDEAKAAFERALKINPDYLPAQFFLALDASQEERAAEAESRWSKLIAASPQNAPWLKIAQAGLADARQRQGKSGEAPMVSAQGASAQQDQQAGPPTGMPGPNSADVAAAAGMSEGDRQAMIEGMVAQLATRLEQEPDDVEGWKRLIRSYTVLGKPEKAAEAFGKARQVFADNSAAGREIAAFGAQMGLTQEEGTKTQ